MNSNLKKELSHRQNRVIGYPSGYFEANVRFASSSGQKVSWWHGGISPNNFAFMNLIGRGDPESSRSLNIDLQFNIPIKKFSRTHGGVFIQDISSGTVVLGHRGIVTRGKSRVPRDLLLSEANITMETVLSDVNPGSADVLFVAPLNKSGLAKDIREFAIEVRRAASLVMESDHQQNMSNSSNRSATSQKNLNKILGEYFDEFSGKRTFNRKAGQVTMDCRHGEIVKSLRKTLREHGKQYKSQAIDLAVETLNKIMLYEVKTSRDTQSIYTGIGQLYVHGAALTREYTNKRLERILVLPSVSGDSNNARICKELGIKLVSFNYSRNNITFSGL